MNSNVNILLNSTIQQQRRQKVWYSPTEQDLTTTGTQKGIWIQNIVANVLQVSTLRVSRTVQKGPLIQLGNKFYAFSEP
jgi:hypothetical protein